MQQNLNFGQAIEALNEGKRVQRQGWNGKGMHIYKEDMFVFPQSIPDGINKGLTRSYDPCIVLFTAQGTHQPGWNASTPDLFATDWQIVE